MKAGEFMPEFHREMATNAPLLPLEIWRQLNLYS